MRTKRGHLDLIVIQHILGESSVFYSLTCEENIAYLHALSKS